ncbi:substrate-binding domain-containing protein [Streptomyces sp. NPDC098077]|uniref:substrate-binding domain-containing protein n=1 Tax=Streptomyces sp. NPDC098077 TaxID=3366093 RepID=UPI0037F1E131
MTGQHVPGLQRRLLQRLQQRQHRRRIPGLLLRQRDHGVPDVHRPDGVRQRLVEEPAAQHPALGLAVPVGGQLGVQARVLAQPLHRLRPLAPVRQHPQTTGPRLVRERTAGRDVPVVGFDDILLADLFEPPLTTVRHPLTEMAAETFQQLRARIEAAPSAGRSLLIRPRLVVRESTAPVPANAVTSDAVTPGETTPGAATSDAVTRGAMAPAG